MSTLKTFLQDASPFVVGGLSIGGLTLLTKYISVKWGIILWIAPISLIISATVLYYFGGQSREDNTKKIRTMLWQSVPGMILLTLVLVVWALALNHFDYWPAFGIMMAAYVVAATIFFLAFCPSPLPGGKCWNIGQQSPDTTVSPVQSAFIHREGIVFRDKKLVRQERRMAAGFRYSKERSREKAREVAEEHKEEEEEEENILRGDKIRKELDRFRKVLEWKPSE